MYYILNLIHIHFVDMVYVGDPTSTRGYDISYYISGCKPHLMRFDFMMLS